MNKSLYDQSYYDKHYLKRDNRLFLERYYNKKLLSIYLPKKKNAVILDSGCGTGRFCFLLSKLGYTNITGIDNSKIAIEVCNKHKSNIKFMFKNFVSTGFNNNTFDVIYSIDTIEHITMTTFLDFLKEANRILALNGRLVIYTPNPNHLFERMKKHNFILKQEDGHIDVKEVPRLEESLNKNGFRIEKIQFFESHIPVFNLIEKVFLNKIPLFRRRTAIVAVTSSPLEEGASNGKN